VLLNISCKVTEKDVVGVYLTHKPASYLLGINADHTFLFEYYDKRSMVNTASADSFHFVTKGNWKLGERRELILNSYEGSFKDTNRVRKILKSAATSTESNFRFKNIYGNIIEFGRVSNHKKYAKVVEAKSIDDGTFSNVNFKISQDDSLIFEFENYKPLSFVVRDSTPTNYIITLAPYYKQVYFKNKILNIKRNSVVDDSIKIKKIKNAAPI
jgi:hypothetical protein